MKKLEAFASANKETQGKFTIGDEKLHNVFMRLEVRRDPKNVQEIVLSLVAGSRGPEVHWQKGSHRCHGSAARGEELYVESAFRRQLSGYVYSYDTEIWEVLYTNNRARSIVSDVTPSERGRAFPRRGNIIPRA